MAGNAGVKMSNCMAVRRFFANHCRITTKIPLFTTPQRKKFICARTTTHFVTKKGLLVRFMFVYIVNLDAICD